jgi:hypothetical protein
LNFMVILMLNFFYEKISAWITKMGKLAKSLLWFVYRFLPMQYIHFGSYPREFISYGTF